MQKKTAQKPQCTPTYFECFTMLLTMQALISVPLQGVYKKDSILFFLIYLLSLVGYGELAVTQNQNLLIWTQSQYDIWRCLMPLVTEMEKIQATQLYRTGSTEDSSVLNEKNIITSIEEERNFIVEFLIRIQGNSLRFLHWLSEIIFLSIISVPWMGYSFPLCILIIHTSCDRSGS